MRRPGAVQAAARSGLAGVRRRPAAGASGGPRGDVSLIPAGEFPCLCAPLPRIANVVPEQDDRVENVPARGRPTWHQRLVRSMTVDRFPAGGGASGGSRSRRGLCDRPRPLAFQTSSAQTTRAVFSGIH